MTKEDRIAKYVAGTAPAISGQDGHKRTLSVARTLFNGFSLSEQDTLRWLSEFSKRCDPPWSEKELIHKVKSAATASYDRSSGWMLNPGEPSSNGNGKLIYERKPAKADFVEAMKVYLRGFSCTESDLYEASPIKPSEDFHQDGPLLVENAFEPEEGVNFVLNFKVNTRKDGVQKADPIDSGVISERNQLIRVWKIDGTPSSDAGGWLRINPVKDGVSDANVTAYRMILVEFDTIPIEMQLSFFARFPAPITAILSSGGHSVHAWLRMDCQDRAEYDSAFSTLERQLSRFGMDNKNKNPARLSRLAGAVRKIGAEGDGRQRLIYLNPAPEPKAILA